MTPIRKILLITAVLSFVGCATPTKPNISYSGPIPELDKIELRNPRLATELRKLPEIQDGVSPLESSALEKIFELYNKFPDKFNETFDEMYQVGKPDVRKYCSPLQALLWGYMDGRFKEGDNPFENYIDALEFVKPIWGKMEGPRWDNFDEVTSRLNLPELIDYYEKGKFSYKWMGVRFGSYPSPKSIFVGGRTGSCHYYASFGKYCLQKANFEAWVLSYKWEQFLDGWDGHSITAYKAQDKFFVIDNGIPPEKGGPRGISGPFDSKKNIPKDYSMRRVIEYTFMK